MTSNPVEPAPVRRRWLTAGALADAVVATVFGTVGDGVEAGDAHGVRAFAVEHLHTVTWVLLAFALAAAVVVGRWSRLSQGLAVTAGACYVVFLAAVLL